jgi:hypothetical protein
MKMEKIECSETPAYKIETPGNYPKENIIIIIIIIIIIFLDFHKKYNSSEITLMLLRYILKYAIRTMFNPLAPELFF